MDLAELFREALRAIRTHALRSFLTLLGIVIGVATLVGVISVISGLNLFVRDKLFGLAPGRLRRQQVRHHPQPARSSSTP